MADWKTLDEANKEYDILADKAAEVSKTLSDNKLELQAAKENAVKDSEKIKALEKELADTKKVNYALSLRANVEKEKKSASELINNLFFGGENNDSK